MPRRRPGYGVPENAETFASPFPAMRPTRPTTPGLMFGSGVQFAQTENELRAAIGHFTNTRTGGLVVLLGKIKVRETVEIAGDDIGLTAWGGAIANQEELPFNDPVLLFSGNRCSARGLRFLGDGLTGPGQGPAIKITGDNFIGSDLDLFGGDRVVSIVNATKCLLNNVFARADAATSVALYAENSHYLCVSNFYSILSAGYAYLNGCSYGAFSNIHLPGGNLTIHGSLNKFTATHGYGLYISGDSTGDLFSACDFSVVDIDGADNKEHCYSGRVDVSIDDASSGGYNSFVGVTGSPTLALHAQSIGAIGTNAAWNTPAKPGGTVV